MGYKFTKAFRNAMKAFCKESSLTGLQFLVNPQISFLEKCMWAFLELLLFSGALIMIFETVKATYDHPLVITLETIKHPISNISFPGVSICNVNKISKRRAYDLAQILSQKTNFSTTDTLMYIKMLGLFYSLELETIHNILKSHENLEKHEDGVIDMYKIMKNLTTPCEELLRRCNWKNKQENCSDLFEMRQTFEGFCCTFNYVRNRNRKPQFLNESGFEHGLTVIVRNEPDDYLYPIYSTVGVNVHIFDPHDYPDMESGKLNQKLIALGTETFLGITADTLYSVPYIQKYPVNVRNCFFNDERKTEFGRYSLSNCLTECKLESLIALCECVPFTIPSPNYNVSECLLLDAVCLAKNSEKWQNIYPKSQSHELEQERQNGLRCECFDGCSSTNYYISSSSAPLHRKNYENFENYSVIRIYFESNYNKLYKREVVSYWYEILSSIGGLLSIFLGFSVITIVEFFYFIIFRIKS